MTPPRKSVYLSIHVKFTIYVIRCCLHKAYIKMYARMIHHRSYITVFLYFWMCCVVQCEEILEDKSLCLPSFHIQTPVPQTH